MSEYKQLKFISYLQIIGIILVVLGHSFHQYPDGVRGHTLWLYRLIYNVHMPIFTFVSGYLMYYTSFVAKNQRRWHAFTKNKIKRLLIPYLTLSLVTFWPRATMSSMADDVIELSWSGLIDSLIYPGHMVIPYFWYLQMIFILLIGVYAILILSARYKIKLDIVIVMLLAMFWILPFVDVQYPDAFAIQQVARLGFYFVLGIVYCDYSPKIDKLIPFSNGYVTILNAVIWIVLFFAFEETSIARIATVFGILAFLGICQILENKKITILYHLRGVNYIIFLLSWYVNVLTQQVLSHFIELPWWLHTSLSLIGGIYLPYLGYKFLRKHHQSRWGKLTAFLLGQNIQTK